MKQRSHLAKISEPSISITKLNGVHIGPEGIVRLACLIALQDVTVSRVQTRIPAAVSL